MASTSSVSKSRQQTVQLLGELSVEWLRSSALELGYDLLQDKLFIQIKLEIS